MVDEKLTVLSPRLGKNGGCEAQNCGYLEMHGPLSSNCFEPLSPKVAKRIARPRLEAMMEARKSWHLTPQGVWPNWLLIGKQELATEEIRTR